MAVGFGFAMSHAPPVHQHREATSRWLDKTLTKQNQNGWVVPASTARLTPEVLDGYWVRTRRSFDVLRKRLQDYNPETIVVFGGNNAGHFPTERQATVTVFTGDEVYGLISGDASGLSDYAMAGNKPDESMYVRHYTDTEFAHRILDGLKERGFDVEGSDTFEPTGAPLLQDDWANPTEIFPQTGVRSVLIALRYSGVGPSGNSTMFVEGDLCYELGKAVAEIVQDSPKRIAVCGSGGLSHDPSGPRNMWIDVPLDHWVLDQIKGGTGEALSSLFVFDSMTMRAGTREIAAWVAATGAMESAGGTATIIDYIGDAPQLQGGIGYAYWEVQPVAAGT